MSGTEDKRSRRQRVSSVRMRDLSVTSCVDNGSLWFAETKVSNFSIDMYTQVCLSWTAMNDVPRVI